jgi:hypothetical protein
MLLITRLATAAASNGLLTGQILFSLALCGQLRAAQLGQDPVVRCACLYGCPPQALG